MLEMVKRAVRSSYNSGLKGKVENAELKWKQTKWGPELILALRSLTGLIWPWVQREQQEGGADRGLGV